MGYKAFFLLLRAGRHRSCNSKVLRSPYNQRPFSPTIINYKLHNTMANQYVTIKNDSFQKITTAESTQIQYYLPGRKLTLTETASFNFRHVSAEPSVEALLIDVHFSSSELNKLGIKSGSLKSAIASYAGEWAFLREGKLIIQLNGNENISLIPHESDSDVTRNGLTDASACEELCYYEIDKTILEKICEAKTLKMQLSGGRAKWTIEGNDLIFLAKAFYNGFYDKNRYADEIKHADDVQAQRDAIKKKGCAIELISVFIYVILFFAFDLEHNDDGALVAISMIFALVIPITVAIIRRKKAKEIK